MHPTGDPTGTRTRISTLKGWCPRPVRRWGQINAGFYLTCRQLQVRPVQPVSEKISLVKRWTRPIRSYLIVKLLFVVAEPAHSLFFDNSLYFHDLLCSFLQSNSCTFSYCCNSLGHQAERNGLFQHYPLYYLDMACTFASWLAQARRAWSGTLLTGVLLLVTLRRLELTISGLRGQLPIQLEDRAI